MSVCPDLIQHPIRDSRVSPLTLDAAQSWQRQHVEKCDQNAGDGLINKQRHLESSHRPRQHPPELLRPSGGVA